MTDCTRRQMLRGAIVAGAIGAALPRQKAMEAAAQSATAPASAGAPAPGRRMTIDLNCGAIGVRASMRDTIQLASQYGFESVAPDGDELGRMTNDEVQALLTEMKAKSVVWGAAGLPVQFREDEGTFMTGLKRLTAWAMALNRAGVRRVGTWILPCHDSLTYMVNFRQHASRLRLCAKLLEKYKLRLGLEYVGPKTFWTKMRHPFIHTMAETRELIAEINMKNVGLLLDSWHWYCAGETPQDILKLKNDDVVAVDLNDAPPGLERDQQVDQRRELPATTGVIDVKAFLSCLLAIGYDGPVRAEPFNPSLNSMERNRAVAATAEAMKRAFAKIQ